ncbi:hypothetical protein NE237_000275 [Protea cynaroides]|uniref:Uncharacterized protein n=1 Tax=Protea cynaroides TaxID=273540 RepID=A0A9Q0KR86_9MAGN|nr:hypothetical protein NE237_000275 [Protea cynaroides]
MLPFAEEEPLKTMSSAIDNVILLQSPKNTISATSEALCGSLPHPSSMPVWNLNLPPNVLFNGVGLPHSSSMPVLNLNLPLNVLSNGAGLPHSSSMPFLNLNLSPNVLFNGAGPPHPSSMPVLNPTPNLLSSGATMPMLSDIIHRDTDTEKGGRESG